MGRRRELKSVIVAVPVSKWEPLFYSMDFSKEEGAEVMGHTEIIANVMVWPVFPLKFCVDFFDDVGASL